MIKKRHLLEMIAVGSLLIGVVTPVNAQVIKSRATFEVIMPKTHETKKIPVTQSKISETDVTNTDYQQLKSDIQQFQLLVKNLQKNNVNLESKKINELQLYSTGLTKKMDKLEKIFLKNQKIPTESFLNTKKSLSVAVYKLQEISIQEVENTKFKVSKSDNEVLNSLIALINDTNQADVKLETVQNIKNILTKY